MKRLRKIIQGVKNIFAYIPIIYKDRDWDYFFLWKIEKQKLNRMLKYFETSNISDEDEKNVRAIKWALKMLDIMLGNNKVFDFIIEQGETKVVLCHSNPDRYAIEQKIEPTIKITRYVNTRNANRFCNGFNAICGHLRAEYLKGYLEEELRLEKAKNIYYRIMQYHIIDWWN